jgi:hypothetical protein
MFEIKYTRSGAPTKAAVDRLRTVVRALRRLGMPEATEGSRLLRRLQRQRRQRPKK